MPRFDGTGPMGMGPMTGRGFGPCAGGRGFLGRRGFGRGRGLGRFFNWGWSQEPADQKKSLADYRKALEEELEDVIKEEKELNA